MEKLIIVKIGGNVIDHPENLASFLKKFAQISEKKLLVHGGGKTASSLAEFLGIETNMRDGRRITCRDTLKVVTMVYGGLLNKDIVSQLQARNCNALGLTGADGNIMVAQKREVTTVDYGFVGDIIKTNVEPLITLLNSGITPVVAPLTHDQKGSMLNTNADTIARALASVFTDHYHVELIYCFAKKGVLASIEEVDSVFPKISLQEYGKLKTSGIISKGMLPKMDNAFKALESGVKRVLICHAGQVVTAVNKINKVGTELCLE